MDFISNNNTHFDWSIIDAIFPNSDLAIGLGIIVLFLGCLLPFYIIPYRYTLQRAPYFLSITLLIYGPAYVQMFLPASSSSPYFELIFIFVQAFLVMSLSIMRARDAFGRGAFAVIFLIPLLNIGLFTVSHEEGEKPYPKNHKELPLPKFCRGISGTLIATIIWLSPFVFGIIAAMLATKPNQW